jgi:N-hydroxyarylamine O-acetyltransferase
MQACLRGEWRTLYRFDLQRQYPIDYEASSYYLSTHPASGFVTGLVAARSEPGRRIALRGRELAIHELGGDTARRALSGAREIMDVLEREFRIALPDPGALERRLAALP